MASSQEKVGFENVEAADSDHAGNKVAPVSADDFGFTPEEQKKIMRHVDRRLVLTVGAMYCVSLMDRTNLGAANIAGMGVDLMLIGNRYVRFSFPPSPKRHRAKVLIRDGTGRASSRSSSSSRTSSSSRHRPSSCARLDPAFIWL